MASLHRAADFAVIDWQVVEWVLGPIRAGWTRPDWLRHLATPDAFYARFVSVTEAADGRAEVPKSCMYSLNPVFGATGAGQAICTP